MHDLKWIRENPKAFDEALVNRNKEPLSSSILSLDETRRAHQTRLQELQAQSNATAKAIGAAMGKKDLAEAERLKASVADLKGQIQAGEAAARDLEAELNGLLAGLPNVPDASVPVGADEHANVELHKWGTPRQFNYQPKQHFEIGEALGLMDFETASRISGARFVILKGKLARLERALGQFMLDLHTDVHGYTEVDPPFLVRADAAYGTGNLPKFAEDLFQTSKVGIDLSMSVSTISGYLESKANLANPGDFSDLALKPEVFFESIGELRRQADEVSNGRLYLVPTAEIPLTNIVREQILDEAVLPYRFTAWTPCFRSEAGSAGRDTRGMIRQHQFLKVELVSITTPDKSDDEHKRMLGAAEEVLKRLELPFRTVTLCTGDMGFSSKKTFDIEVWLPGQNAYREISSCSNCGDFQARRMDARYRPAGEKATRFVHTLNGSGVAVGRCLVAVLENYQNEDGSVTVPAALRPYMGGLEVIR